MLFNSIEFLLFLPIVFFLYWFVVNKNLKLQNFLILVASYVFYGWWDWRFLSLIAFSTFVDYWVGLSIYNAKKTSTRKMFLWLSLGVNLGLLGFFKYYNFFVDSWIEAWGALGYTMHASTLSIILPVGISFYTFQTLSYSIDIYRGKLKPTTDFLAFGAFVSFFPQLVAGPIERASNLLPQILSKRKFSYKQSVEGLRLILWGLFKKVVIADSLAPMVKDIFANYDTLNGSTLVLGAVYFAFQIYGDFSGYSDIAIGTSKLFGFELMSNFKFPYLARDIAEFWRRWHISLSTWFRDYLYIPLGGSRVNKSKAIRNVFAIFLVSGFWHGANWTFLVWGGIHALLFIPLFITNRNRKNAKGVVAENSMLPNLNEIGNIVFTFFMVTIAWVFFRAQSIEESFAYLAHIPTDLFSRPLYITGLFYVFGIFILDYLQRKDERNVLAFFENRSLRFLTYFVFVELILFHAQSAQEQEFIYFQF